ncbi:MAG: FmdB family transcriptional regulator [Opitutaceae bacterium]
MPIYEYYCRDNHRIYQFYAKTLAQSRTIPKCPDNPAYRMEKIVSAFSVSGAERKSEKAGGATEGAGGTGEGDPGGDARMDTAMAAMEREFSSVDENDPRAMGRMMRRMAELTGEKIDGEMEEVVRKLEEGADPDSLEEEFGGEEDEADADHPGGGEPGDAPGSGDAAGTSPAAKAVGPVARPRPRGQPTRDPKLYDFD